MLEGPLRRPLFCRATIEPMLQPDELWQRVEEVTRRETGLALASIEELGDWVNNVRDLERFDRCAFTGLPDRA